MCISVLFRWYHGAISRKDAENLLRMTKEGSFLVRNSESSQKGFSLSLKWVNHGNNGCRWTCLCLTCHVLIGHVPPIFPGVHEDSCTCGSASTAGASTCWESSPNRSTTSQPWSITTCATVCPSKALNTCRCVSPSSSSFCEEDCRVWKYFFCALFPRLTGLSTLSC